MLFRKKRKLSSNAVSTKESGKAEISVQSKSEEEEWNETSAETHTATMSVADVAARNDCVYCHRGEEDDPSGTDEDDYLACSVCGDNAHQTCAKNNNTLQPETALEDWRCSGCVENALEPSVLIRKLSVSSSRMARNLLATGQDVGRPLKHSIFNTLILEDDLMDGSRTLRKRKASSEAADFQYETLKKPKRVADTQSQATVDNAKRALSVKSASVRGASPAIVTSPELEGESTVEQDEQENKESMAEPEVEADTVLEEDDDEEEEEEEE